MPGKQGPENPAHHKPEIPMVRIRTSNKGRSIKFLPLMEGTPLKESVDANELLKEITGLSNKRGKTSRRR